MKCRGGGGELPMEENLHGSFESSSLSFEMKISKVLKVNILDVGIFSKAKSGVFIEVEG